MTCNRWPLHTDLRAVYAGLLALAEGGNELAEQMAKDMYRTGALSATSTGVPEMNSQYVGVAVEWLLGMERDLYSVSSLLEAFASLARVRHLPELVGAGAGGGRDD